MNSWKKTNEAYFGDSFDRSNMSTAYLNNATYDSAIATAIDKCAATANCSVSSLDGLVNYVKADNGVSLKWDEINTKADISTLQDQFNILQAQIDDLKKSYTTTTKLRLALKTLQYKREVE